MKNMKSFGSCFLLLFVMLCCFPALGEEINEQKSAIQEEKVVPEKTVDSSSQKTTSGATVVSAPDLSNLKDGISAEVLEVLPKLIWKGHDAYKGYGSHEAKKGGTLKYVSPSFPATLRTVGKNSGSGFNRMLTSLCYETLLDLDPITYDYAPLLANKWAIAEDKVSFFFHIDERAKWSDGVPVTSNDMVATWDKYVDPGIEDPFNNDYYSKYERPIAITDQVVMIKSKKLNWRTFMSAGFFVILPGHILSKISGEEFLKEYQFKMLPGSGPYTYESSKTNEEIILRRRTDWWQKDFERTIGYNNFDKLHYLFISDENLVKEKFKKGELDWLHVLVAREWHQEFIPAMMPQIAKGWIQKRKVYTHQPCGTQGIAFNMRKPPFDDIRIRKAIAYLFNREKMMDKLFFNEYEFLDSFYPNSPYENPDNPKIRYNPDKAVELLEEAGWLQANRDSDGWLVKDGKRFEVTLNFVSKGSERFMTVFQEDLRDVGIKLNLKQVTWATDIKEVGERNFQMNSRAYGAILFPNPESSMHSKFADKPNNNNIWGLKNDRIDEICASYTLMFDPKERIEAVKEIDGIAAKMHLYALGWFSPHTRILYWNKFGMPPGIMSKISDERSIASLWWYDEEKDKALKEAMKNDTKLPRGKEVVKWWDENYPQKDLEVK